MKVLSFPYQEWSSDGLYYLEAIPTEMKQLYAYLQC